MTRRQELYTSAVLVVFSGWCLFQGFKVNAEKSEAIYHIRTQEWGERMLMTIDRKISKSEEERRRFWKVG